jgi:uncharacterized DUF497 family protein
MSQVSFEWDVEKDLEIQTKRGVLIAQAQYTFADPHRAMAEDLSLSQTEKRYYCFETVGGSILTVRSTNRKGPICIYGAGYWRKGKPIDEHENHLHR